MPVRDVSTIRNIAFVGHSGAGKTTLGEAMLFKSGVTNRMGSVDDGTSVLDNDDESKERRHSVDSSFFYVEHNGALINVFDTPGMPDYCGTAIAALSGCETAVVVISAASGIGVNTRRMFSLARDYGLACMIVVNRIDAENVELEELYAAIRETFGQNCHAINLPADGGKRLIDVLESEEGKTDLLDVASCHTELLDTIVETDDELMEVYMGGGKIPHERLGPAIRHATAIGHLIPVLFTNARGDVGITELMDDLVTYAPSPADGRRRSLRLGEGEAATETPLEPEADQPFCGRVCKVLSDPKSNIKYSIVRVFRGTMKGDGHIHALGDRKGQRPGHVLKLRGVTQEEIDVAGPGDVVAFAKLDVQTRAPVFGEAVDAAQIESLRYPTPMYALAVEPKSRADIEKIGAALHRFAEEDPCFEYDRNPETHELVMRGMGDQHLTIIRSKMKRYFKLEVDTHSPKIPYHETITGKVQYVEYTHKKQSGGAGQYAKVVIDMEPAERGAGYEFADKIFGGAIDQSYRPSVDKGVRDQMKKGVIAGYPVVDVKVSLVDGKTHPVDSKDIAFQIAGRQVFKKAFAQCKPILLEPVVKIEVTAPAEFMGEITRDIAGKRGQVAGQDMLPGNQVCVRGIVPLSEVAAYSSQLKSVTGGQGSYSMEMSHYDVVPPNVQQQIVAAHKPVEEEE